MQLLSIILPLMASYWVYNDAKARRMNNPTGWAIFVFLVLLIGLPVYLFKRKKSL